MAIPVSLHITPRLKGSVIAATRSTNELYQAPEVSNEGTDLLADALVLEDLHIAFMIHYVKGLS